MSPTRSTYVRDSLLLGFAGVAGWGLAPLAGQPQLAVPSVAVGLVASTSTFISGRRRADREFLLDYFAQSVVQLTGAPVENARALIKATSWTGGRPGMPKTVRLYYGHNAKTKTTEALGVEVGDSKWASELAKLAGRRFGGTYRVRSNNQVRGQLRLELVKNATPKPKDSPQVQRATKYVNRFLGGTATVKDVEVDPETGQPIRMLVEHDIADKLAASGYRRRVEAGVSTVLPGRWRAKWDLEADSVVLEVRPSLPESVWIEPLEPPADDPLANYREVKIPYGVDEDGEVIAWRPAVSPQWLMTGGTGSGKTSTGHGILTQISRYGWPIWIADGKGVEFLGFQDWPNVQIVASSIPEQIAVIHRAWELMEYRYQLVVERRARSEDFEPLMVFVDEFTDLKANLLTWYSQIKVKGDPTKPVTLSQIGSIARKGRTARVHLVLTLQRPDAEILTGEVRENFGQRTSLGPISPQGAEMMWNNPVTGVALPRGRTGRAIGTNNVGVPVEMQAYRVPDPKDVVPGTTEYELIERLRPAHSKHERLLIVQPETNWDTGEPIEPTFTDYAQAEWVLAKDRPDLDPLVNLATADRADVDGRALSSPLASLGLVDIGGAGVPGRRGMSPTSKSSRLQVDVDDAVAGAVDQADELDDGYDLPSTIRAAALIPGDRICVDADTGHWAVVEEEPIADFDDDESLVISWRDDEDSSGQNVIPADALVEVRRPRDLEDAA